MRVMRVDEIETAGPNQEPKRSQRCAGQAPLRRHRQQRTVLPGEQKRLVAGFDQRPMQPQDLPLSAAHFTSAVEMEDLHARGSRALAYFMKV